MAKFLVIAEKPSVAQSLAKNLSAYQRKDGYLEGNSCIVSWCLGHLAEYVPPEIYDEKYAKWQFEDLPIIPEVWKVQVSEDKIQQMGHGNTADDAGKNAACCYQTDGKAIWAGEKAAVPQGCKSDYHCDRCRKRRRTDF